MKVTFVRSPGERDRIYVVRDDGSQSSWAFPSYGEGMPHDLVHFVVEQRFGVTRGVWGRVAAGAELGRDYSGLGSDPELLLAEQLANAPWLRPDEDLRLPVPASDALIVEVRAELLALHERWHAGRAIELHW